MSPSNPATGVLLVGSVPLDSPSSVFTKLSSALPGRLRSIPDGETGERYNFIGWQRNCFPPETIKLRLDGKELPSYPEYELGDVGPPKYDDAAIASYQDFVALREKGVIPSDVRFQVSIPAPLNAVQGHTRAEFHEQIYPLYEQHFLSALSRITSTIPAEDLAIQWDLCYEVMALEYERGRVDDEEFKAHFSPVMDGILERVARLCAVIPHDVQLGFHLCYGDLRHKHFMEPVDADLLVELANELIGKLPRKVEWIHMPVPKSRTDTAYFDPLKNLKLNGAYLYLGLVHANDEEGTRERIRTAGSVFKQSFGVATECGLGRTPNEDLESILRISELVSRPWDGAAQPRGS